MSLAEAVAETHTGDIWLFRGRSVADTAIRVSTNSPVNHVGMAVSIDDLPPLLWHAELGRSLPDVWSGQHRPGAQLHVLTDAVRVWATRYRQRVWLRQLDFTADPADEDAILRTIARLDGTPFPSAAGLAKRWVQGRWRRGKRPRAETAPTHELESAYCAEIVAVTYQSVGLLPAERAPRWYDPGRFWSGDDLQLGRGAHLGGEIEVIVGEDAEAG
jgi:hypothetical protein